MRSVKHGRKRGKKAQLQKKNLFQKKKKNLKKKQKPIVAKFVLKIESSKKFLAKFWKKNGILS